MKQLILITIMLITSIANAQDCNPETQDDCPTVFEFDCEIDPLTITNDEIEAYSDRWGLLQALIGLPTNSGHKVKSVGHESQITTAFVIKVRDSNGGSFTKHPGGDETTLDEIHPETFREFYRAVLNFILNDF